LVLLSPIHWHHEIYLTCLWIGHTRITHMHLFFKSYPLSCEHCSPVWRAKGKLEITNGNIERVSNTTQIKSGETWWCILSARITRWRNMGSWNGILPKLWHWRAIRQRRWFSLTRRLRNFYKNILSVKIFLNYFYWVFYCFLWTTYLFKYNISCLVRIWQDHNSLLLNQCLLPEPHTQHMHVTNFNYFIYNLAATGFGQISMTIIRRVKSKSKRENNI